MNTRRLFVYSGVLALLISGDAFAGRYQRAKDGKTRVWNENPKPGDLVTWSGARDAKGYATGYGMLTWFTPQKVMLTGSNIARERHYIVSSRVSGIMVHGKFENASASAEPKKRGQMGMAEQQALSADIEATPKKPQSTPAQEKATSPTPTPPSTPANDSLDSLMHAPSSLRLNPPTDASSPHSSPSPTATPDISLQLTPAPSPSPSPN